MSADPTVAGTAQGQGGAGRRVESVGLSVRAGSMSAFRPVFVAVVLGVAYALGDPQVGVLAATAAGYLAVTGLLSAGVWVTSRPVGQRLFGISLLVDGAFAEYLRESLKVGYGTNLLPVIVIVTVTLVASFRTGLKIALWQSVLLLVVLRGKESGLFPMRPDDGSVDGDVRLVVDLLTLWVATLTTASAAWVNERELRRRRFDAERLSEFSDALHLDRRVEEVASHLAVFVVDKIGAERAFVLRSANGRLVVLADSEHSLAAQAASGAAGWEVERRALPTVVGAEDGSALLALPRRADGAARTLRFDPARDTWLGERMPQARRIVVTDLVVTDKEQVALVTVLGGRGVRTETSVAEAVIQATTTAALAWSRAELLTAAERRAATDGLTGLANRRTFDDTLAALHFEYQTLGTPYALVLTDVDKFKSVNDRYGHQAGDQVLQIVAKILMEHAEAVGATAARYGGEEFAVLMSGVGAPVAEALAEQVRLALHDVEEPVRITSSFGVAGIPEHCTTPDALVHRADAALIAAKNAGRDRVMLAGDHVMPAAEGTPAPAAPAAPAAAPAVPAPAVPAVPAVPPRASAAQPVAPADAPGVPLPRRRDLRAPTTPDA